MSETPVVSLRVVSFSYPLPGGASRPALTGVTLEVRAGETLVVLGANGAGKSTLAALLAGVAAPAAGSVVRAPVPDDPPVLPAGLVTQNPEDSFSSPVVREEMGVVLENLERDPAEIDRAVDEMLAEVGLAGHADSHPAKLSGGQKQLLATASVLIADPPLLVLDEPLTLLDGPGRAEVDRLLARLRGPLDATVYLTSEVEEAGRGDRVVVLHRGALVWEGRPTELPQDAPTLGAWGLLSPELSVVEEPASVSTGAAEGWRAAEDPAAGTVDGSSPRTGHDAPTIVVENLHFSYDPGTPRERAVLRGVDLVVRAGEILGVVGAIGSGKTTLIQHLNGLLTPQRGRVVVAGAVLEPGRQPSRLLHREVGLVFQFPEKQLFAETVGKDVAAGPDFAGVPADLAAARARAAIERVGLDPDGYGPRAPYTLTWGEKRLVAIAGVLVLETPHLVLDEPGAGLDPAGRRRVMDLLAELARRAGRAVVVVSHHLDALGRVADRFAVLHQGRIAFTGAPARLRGHRDLERWGLSRPRPAAPTPQTPPPRS